MATKDREWAMGTRVRTVVKLEQRDYVLEAIRRPRQLGTVVGRHDSHGVCFDVRHDEDGVVGVYDPDELLPVMRRFRFKVAGEDYRPIAFPPEGPFWCSGYELVGSRDQPRAGAAVLIAYSPSLEVLTGANRWPDATEVEDLGEQAIEFSERFPQPKWWAGVDGRTTVR